MKDPTHELDWAYQMIKKKKTIAIVIIIYDVCLDFMVDIPTMNFWNEGKQHADKKGLIVRLILICFILIFYGLTYKKNKQLMEESDILN